MTVIVSLGDQVIGIANPVMLHCLAFIKRGNAKFHRLVKIKIH